MKSRAALLCLISLLAACGGGGTTGPGANNGITNVSMKIDGVAWNPIFEVTAINAGPGLYSISGVRTSGANNYTMVMTLYNIRGPGTYPMGAGVNVFGGTANLSQPPANGWTTPLNGASGQINITTLTATRLVATFAFDTQPLLTGSPGAPKVTDGVMDIPVSGTGGLALPNQGSMLVGTIGGPFTASGAQGSITNIGGTTPTLTFVAGNGTRGITISIANMTGPGAYALSATTPVRTIGVSGAPGNINAVWASQIAGGSGSVNITSVTASRVIGSFTATLAPLAGGATGNLAVSGNFEVARQF